MTTTEFSRLVEYLRAARRALVFTGAGVSTGSGIPDFRGPQGLWTRGQQPVYYQEFMTSEAARIRHWEYKLGQWQTLARAKPNAAHAAIVRIEKHDQLAAVITQNIDGLHALAGTSPDFLVELHGTNALVSCQTCGERSHPGPHFAFFEESRQPPTCSCGGFLKPATISFGQALDGRELARAHQATERADLVIALGSTLSVQPAASFPLRAALTGVPYVIINQGATDHDRLPCVSLRLEADVGDVFPAAVDASLAASS
ncbi:MAG TPA: Sir2 family NAD-dependent protein deacetylase [Chthoniobacterales bacterium]